MALQRTSQQMQNQIKELLRQGHSKRQIARSLGICRKTINKVLADEGDLKAPVAEPRGESGLLDLDWESLVKQASQGVPIKTLWEEQDLNVSYRIFWGELRRRKPATKPVTIKLHHTPGEKAQIDFCDGINLVCRKTSAITKTHLFELTC
ncbi:MAG: helix-turn-helix domain-containing protein [Pseudobdellovibrionaceae bacterium]|nr:MAG: helix-turn-helix domain-containing protein [Pseudobdellovibrionaceae bacterium]